MIIPPGPLKVMVATKPVDFRKGAVGLAALVEHELAGKPFSGVAWVFRARRANRIKILVWDGSGLVLEQSPSVRRLPVATRRQCRHR